MQKCGKEGTYKEEAKLLPGQQGGGEGRGAEKHYTRLNSQRGDGYKLNSKLN
jgi:hypothetical protein